MKPAPVQEQNDLPSVVQCVGHRLAERLAQPAHDGLFVPHVDDLDGRHGPVADPARHRQPGVPAALGVAPAFERWRGRAQNHRDPFHLRSLDGHVARVVPRRRLLFEAALVLFVDDQQAPAGARARRPPSERRRRPATSPEAMLCQWRCRSASLMWLCSTATRANRRRNRRIVCGVRLISGTSTIASRPRATTSSIAAR